jgi:hypothetical protein
MRQTKKKPVVGSQADLADGDFVIYFSPHRKWSILEYKAGLWTELHGIVDGLAWPRARARANAKARAADVNLWSSRGEEDVFDLLYNYRRRKGRQTARATTARS